MKKIFLSLSTTIILTTASWADISSTQLKTYLHDSGMEMMLENMKNQLSQGIEQQVTMKGEAISPKILEGIKKIASKPENIDKFTNGLKHLDEKDYNNIVKFYKTDLGKKVANIAATMDMVKMQESMMQFAQKKVSPKRKELLAELSLAMMSEEMQFKLAKEMALTMVASLPKEMQEMMTKQIDAQMEQMKPMLKQQMELSTAFTYRTLSNDELKEMIKYSKSTSGSAEIQAIVAGTVEYMKTAMSEMMNMMMKEKKAEMAQKKQ